MGGRYVACVTNPMHIDEILEHETIALLAFDASADRVRVRTS
jgi:hypothetical protein